MHFKPTCFASPKLTHKPYDSKGNGVLAAVPIRRGEILTVFGGDVVHADDLSALPVSSHRLLLQIEEELYLLSRTEGLGDWINHSCDPNAGLRGQVVLVAMRDIEPGEEICYDYAMSDGTDYDTFECQCGSSLCRGQISGEDWRIPLLWRRYRGYFSPYLQRRIDTLRAAMSREAQVESEVHGREIGARRAVHAPWAKRAGRVQTGLP